MHIELFTLIQKTVRMHIEGRTKRRVSVQTAISVNDKYFKTHPAFEKNVDYGGWSSKLEGMWVAKYEASQVRGTTTPKFEPGVNSSWKSITIGDVYMEEMEPK